jgi:hypothetical protein
VGAFDGARSGTRESVDGRAQAFGNGARHVEYGRVTRARPEDGLDHSDESSAREAMR